MIVIFGSTGFTGRLVTRYFAKHVSKRFPDLEWCIAGRNREKLEMLRDSLDTKPSIRVGDGTKVEAPGNGGFGLSEPGGGGGPLAFEGSGGFDLSAPGGGGAPPCQHSTHVEAGGRHGTE